MTTNNIGKLTVLVGGQYGSEGKGAIAAAIANDYRVHVRVGSPNAGHTIYWKGEKHVMQSIPCGWINPDAAIVIGRGALINMRLLMKELVHIMQYYPDFLKRLFIDAEAGILDEKFHEQEGGVDGENHHRIGSTGEGVGPARIARLERDPQKFRQFKDVAKEYGLEECVCENTPELIMHLQNNRENVLIEGTQGSGLSLYHSFWPYCTTTETNASGIIAEVGISPLRVTNVIMVCRTFPIRVAGNSGPMKDEISWEEISNRIGRKVEEKTTVTHKVRRVGKWDNELFRNACVLNYPTEIALTFCDYVDPDLHGCDMYEGLVESEKLKEFIDNNLPMYKDQIKYFGTGPDTVVKVEEKNNG